MNYDEFFDYDPVAGTLIRKSRDRRHFPDDGSWRYWNAEFSGKIAGGVTFKADTNRAAAVRVSLFGRKELAHLIIWELNYGPVPAGMFIDHKDGDPTNNKFDNLRLATNSQNQANRRRKSNATHSLKGVTFERGRKRGWSAQMRRDGKTFRIGRYATKEEAHAAYCQAAKDVYGEFARSG